MIFSRPNAGLRALCNLALPFALLSAALSTHAQTDSAKPAACASDDSGLQLPPGFCATVFADDIGHARHMVVANGVLYVNTWSGRYYGRDTPHEGGFVVALQDTKGAGKADVTERFGETAATGGAGGTGIGFYKGALYVEINDRIVRYTLSSGSIVPKGSPETIVSDLPLSGDHPQHGFAIDPAGFIYMDVASASNACQEQNRTLKSPGVNPCTELETRAGIWRYDAKKTNQKFSPAERYATGIRNAGGIAFDASGKKLYSTQHGRDQLAENWPDLYRPEQGATLPAEELMQVERGSDFGWPTCYYDPVQRKRVLAPEYGGDGGKAVGDCAQKGLPVASFPAHWAPNAVTIYSGKQFPARYQDGAFIAFHGSWNRAPYPQGGFNVVFQSLSDPGTCEIFADGFASVKDRGKAEHRPSGVAVAPDGALFISDDWRGRIYRVTYQGGAATAAAKGTPCPSPDASPGQITSTAPSPSTSPALPVAAGATSEMVAQGDRVYHGQSATCVGCHGADATGTQLGPDLTDSKWLWGDGSLAAIAKSITEGVAQPKEYRAPMPALGGGQLSAADVSALAAYLWGLSHRNAGSAAAAAKAELKIPGERIFPESLTSTTDGTILIGSLGARTIFRAKAGDAAAEAWIQPELDAAQGIYGVFADNRSKTLYACVSGVGAAGASAKAELLTFDLKSGKPKGRYAFASSGGLCNDIATGADGTAYVTDSRNMEVLRLKPHAKALEKWLGDGAFGPKGGIIDGISVLSNRVLVNTLLTNKLFSVPIERGGKAGTAVEVKLDRAIDRPDGMRSHDDSLLLVESGGVGRLSRVDLTGDTGKVTTLQEGFPGGPVAATVVGADVYVLEAQLAVMRSNGTPTPFHALAFPLSK